MKALTIFYIVYTLIYFLVGGGSVYWGVYNMACILATITGFLYAFIQDKTRVDAHTKSWMKLAAVMTVCRAVYSTSCAIAPVEWIYDMNKAYGIIFTACLIVKIIKERRNGMNYH